MLVLASRAVLTSLVSQGNLPCVVAPRTLSKLVATKAAIRQAGSAYVYHQHDTTPKSKTPPVRSGGWVEAAATSSTHAEARPLTVRGAGRMMSRLRRASGCGDTTEGRTRASARKQPASKYCSTSFRVRMQLSLLIVTMEALRRHTNPHVSHTEHRFHAVFNTVPGVASATTKPASPHTASLPW